jgi:DNA-binding response OmpR family regulator
MLPGMSGLDLARRLRKEDLTRDVPIIMLTARGEETDRVGGLEAGVDDYVVKPFSPRELIARINAVMRRTHGVDGDGVVSIGALRIDSGAHRVYARQEPKALEGNGGPIVAANDAIVPIGPTEYRLLHFFMTHAERVYSRSQLLDYVWGGSVYVEERTVDVHIRRLRIPSPLAAGPGADRARAGYDFRRLRLSKGAQIRLNCGVRALTGSVRHCGIGHRHAVGILAKPCMAGIAGTFRRPAGDGIHCRFAVERAPLWGARRLARLLDMVPGQPLSDPVVAELAPPAAATRGPRRVVRHFCAHV